MKRWIAIVILVVASIGLWSFSAIAIENLQKDVAFWKGQCNELEAELSAPQARVRIREIHFEWGDGKESKIVGEVKNYGSVDAQHVSVGVRKYEGENSYPGNFAWVDYLRAGENKPFEITVSKPYCDDQRIPHIVLSYRTVGEYGHEWNSKVMYRD